MTEREFCFWLRGYILDGSVKTLNEKQLKMIKTQLARLHPMGGAQPEKKKETPPQYHIYK
jgi:hypothetical protein